MKGLTLTTWLAIVYAMSFAAHAQDDEDQVDYTVLAGSTTYDCQFVGETTLAISYQLDGNENAQIVIDGVVNNQQKKIVKVHLKGNTGEKVVTFDAGSCVNNLEVAIR
ncbi:hypothetical protein [Vibrio sp.]|uniref:hypothetical protein n=1 Tax=Vibrio sp. TaxID=678 RepID=UPI003D152EF2